MDRRYFYCKSTKTYRPECSNAIFIFSKRNILFLDKLGLGSLLPLGLRTQWNNSTWLFASLDWCTKDFCSKFFLVNLLFLNIKNNQSKKLIQSFDLLVYSSFIESYTRTVWFQISIGIAQHPTRCQCPLCNCWCKRFVKNDAFAV